MATAMRKPYTPPKKFSFRQLEELWITAGGPRQEAVYAAAIALAESKGVPTAEGKNTNGTIDRGLWQINSVHGKLSTTDILANAKAAVKIHGESGFGPWVTYNTGAYKEFLTPTNLKTAVKQGENVEPQAGLFGVIEGKVPGFSSQGGTEKALEEAVPGFSWAGLSKFAVTAVLLVAGAVLVVYGIIVAARPRNGGLSIPVPL